MAGVRHLRRAQVSRNRAYQGAGLECINRRFGGGLVVINNQLLSITAQMPCKQINVNGPYMQRHWAGKSDRGDYWLHRFLSADGDRHQHNHPWTGRSIVLSGAVTEDLQSGTITREAVAEPLEAAYNFMNGEPHPSEYWIHPDTWNRIASVEPGTWTLMEILAPREPHWCFMEPDGSIVKMKASPRHWYLEYGPRGSNKGDVL